jgi:hypothetical protein
MTEVGCTNAAGAAGTETLTLTVTPSTTYIVRLLRNGTNNNSMNGSICVYEPVVVPANDQCAGAIAVTCGNTYTGSTTFATTTSDPTTTCGTTSGAAGVWYQFTGTGFSTTASLCGSSYDTKIQVYSGTCGSMTCVTGNDDFCSLQSQVTFTSVSGTNYYIFVGGFGTATGTYSLAITCAIPTAPNCATYTAPLNGTTLSCATTNLSWTAAATGGAPSDYLLYFGTNNPPSNINNGTSLGNVLTYSPAALSPATTYYWQIRPSNSVGTASGCAIYSFTTGGTTVVNDVCGGAVPLTSGVTINDDNSCASDEAPLPIGTCWSTGAVNTLWYSISVPAAGTLGVLTTGGSLTNTQIAVYSGPCSTSMTQVGCNDNAPGAGCSATATVNSQVNLTGLSAGTYYIRVDGRSSDVGTYSIMASTTSSVGTALPVIGQDCTSPTTVCANPMTVGNPGYAGSGNVCDFTATGNCTGGEKNSVWLQISITTSGSLNFTIQPNDYVTCDDETDYDFLLWKMSGGGTTTTCTGITSNSATALAACNYSYLGVTGVSASGNAPSGYCADYNASFEPSVAVTAGDVFYLVVQNYSSSTSGFTISFPTTTGNAGINTSTPSSVLWTGGGSSTTWTTASNWGGCAAPSCTPGVDAVVAPSSTFQPTLTGTQNVKNLTINSGSVLTIAAGATLNICGNFVNNGTLTCGAGSIINFNGTGTQTVSGNLTGVNKFANFTVNKTAGTVSLLNNIEVGENLTTSNATSIINTNGVDITLGGNFLNHSGTTTFNGIGTTSMFTFNGTGAQNYDPTVSGGTNITLNNVTMNNTRSGYADVTLLDDLILGTGGTLSLTAGDISTGAFYVIANNTATSSVGTGNTTSFVNGNLRRYLSTSGTYEFPLGNTAKGYQRATTAFSSCSIGFLNTRFDSWASTSPIQGGSECATTYNLNAEDNGYWTLTANTGTGTYDMTLYPLNATNTTGAGGWTVIKSTAVGGTWVLNGSCVASSTAGQVMRTGMSGFSVFAAGQAVTPLPIELLYFRGHKDGSRNILNWATSSETNNDYFDVQRSSDGVTFENFDRVDGAGNSSVMNYYQTEDNRPFGNITYYRLNQVDYNGTGSYSNIIALENKMDEVLISNVRPNPTTNDVYFDFYTPAKGSIKIQLMDYSGRLVIDEVKEVPEGHTSLQAVMSDLAQGIYTLRISFGDGSYQAIKKIVKQ